MITLTQHHFTQYYQHVPAPYYPVGFISPHGVIIGMTYYLPGSWHAQNIGAGWIYSVVNDGNSENASLVHESEIEVEYE